MWERATSIKYFARECVIHGVHNMTGNCLDDPFLLKCIHIYTYLVKKQDPYKIFSLRLKILWEPGAQVSRHFPTLACSLLAAFFAAFFAVCLLRAYCVLTACLTAYLLRAYCVLAPNTYFSPGGGFTMFALLSNKKIKSR